MTIISSYQNGNYSIVMHTDGTKIREYYTKPIPEFPESIDLKISDYCDAGCKFCHEKSTIHGKHADIDKIFNIVKDLPSGVEIAIGGGNPLSHPELQQILEEFKNRGLISNITVNSFHTYLNTDKLIGLATNKLIHGIGVSITDMSESYNVWDSGEEYGSLVAAPSKEPSNVVYHIIVGIGRPHSLLKCKEQKILVLGYKRHGFGTEYYDQKVSNTIKEWRYWIGSIIRYCKHISFDNLAIKQLDIQKLISPEKWQQLYMGDDGEFTMYIDAVKNEYAVSSTLDRFKLDTMTAKQAFQKLKCSH